MSHVLGSNRISIPRGHHQGQRCFVVASGPSIKRTPLDVLDGEVVVAVNQSYQALSRDPDYICIGDRELWPRIKDTYASKSSGIVCGTGLNGQCGSDYGGDNLVALLPLDKTKAITRGARFPRDLERESLVKAFNVITEVALPFVVWCGFSECYLVGCDCSDGGYFYDNPLRDVGWQKVLPEAMQAYQHIADLDLPTKIYNATIGGHLECFPRVDLKELT